MPHGKSAVTDPSRLWRRFWFEFSLPTSKVVLFRVTFFAIVALDAWLQIEHAPRYGAGDFNVSHFPWLDGILPLPSRSGILIVFLVQAFLALRVMFGVAVQSSLGLLTILYGYTYFISQLDSYQHHYLVFLILLLCNLVPWRSSASGSTVSWALRLILVQVAVVYFWAAMAKLETHWLSGQVLQVQIGEGWVPGIIHQLPGGLATGARLVLVTELFLVLALLVRRLWPAALVVGVTFHLGVELAGFQIGLFSYFMFSIYLLVVPDRWVERLAASFRYRSQGRGRCLAQIGESLSSLLLGDRLRAGGAVVVGSLLLWLLPFQEKVFVILATLSLGLVALLLTRSRRATRRVAITHLIVTLIIVCLHFGSEQTFNYYRFWGGTARRLDNREEAFAAYTALARLKPEYGSAHYHLGRLYRLDGEDEKALTKYVRAQNLNAEDYRAFRGEALIHHRAGRGAQAREAVARALELKPDDPQALQMERYWRNRP